MGDRSQFAGPQFRGDRPQEQQAVRTTIVGGRPPGSGTPLGAVPRGVEVLVKKASVDPEFKALLLAERGDAARRINLSLEPAESLMLRAVPPEQLEAIIAGVIVPHEHRRAFLGQAAAAMLAVLAVAQPGCDSYVPVTGSRPPDPKERPAIKGSRPDEPEQRPAPAGIRPPPPKEPPVVKGIRPDMPDAADRPQPTLPDRSHSPAPADAKKEDER